MSCLSRLFGLICAVVPGLLFLALAVMLFPRWAELGLVTGFFYSLVSLITGAVCLYLGLGILFGRDRAEEPAPLLDTALESPVVTAPAYQESAREMVAAPLPKTLSAPEPAPTIAKEPAPTRSIFAKTDDASAPLDTPASRIRQLAATRPDWQVTAPQLAQMTNLNMNIADATAREMVNQGEARVQTGPNGETIYIFDMARENG